MPKRRVYCPVCRAEAEFIRFLGEEVLLWGRRDPETARKAPVSRLVAVHCPEHGERVYSFTGHHVSARKRKRKAAR